MQLKAVKLMVLQLSAAVTDSPEDTELYIFMRCVDNFKNTLGKKCFGKEFIPRFDIILIIFPEYMVVWGKITLFILFC